MGAAHGFKQVDIGVDMVWVIDRIVNGVAVCECLETGETMSITPPQGAKEGHVLRGEGQGFVVDQAMTKQRQAEMATRLNRLFER